MKALSICENLMKAITNKKIVQGRVHSVFKNACNIETEDNFVTLLNTGKGMAPMSLLVDVENGIDLLKLNLKKNSKFSFERNCIYCTEADLFIYLEDAEEWFPGVNFEASDCSEKDVHENIKSLEMGLDTYKKLFDLNPFLSILNSGFPELELIDQEIEWTDKNFEFIRCRFLNFMEAVLKSDIDAAEQTAESIIGFGPGLTPAVDDFISGIMISFIYFGEYYKLDLSKIYEFNKKLINKCLNKTTRVSSEMLKHSAVGQTNQYARELIKSILYKHNQGNILDALARIVEIGETSGSDMAQGIYVGSKIMTNFKYRGEWLNGTMH